MDSTIMFMNHSFPYQLVTFLDSEPDVGESIYNSGNGWYPQIALKRRFAIHGISEADFIDQLSDYFTKERSLEVHTGKLVKTDRMPVQVIEVEPTPELMKLHMEFISHFSSMITSRYPERDGENYYPHITAEYNCAMVIDAEKFISKKYTIKNVWLVKDASGTEDSMAYKNFRLSDS